MIRLKAKNVAIALAKERLFNEDADYLNPILDDIRLVNLYNIPYFMPLPHKAISLHLEHSR